jgi:hypothetical protein
MKIKEYYTVESGLPVVVYIAESDSVILHNGASQSHLNKLKSVPFSREGKSWTKAIRFYTVHIYVYMYIFVLSL